MSNKCPIDRSLRPVPFSQLADRSVDWLWCGWLALGNLNILDGDPGIGKTLLTLDFCARATRGKAFPGNVAALGPVNVVLCNAEDAMEETLRPRLRGMGADLERVFGIHDDESGLAGSLRFPSDKRELDKILTQTKARLVVIDPIVALLDRGIQSSNDQSVRRALRPLMTLARKHQCAILLVRHLNKSGGRRALYRGGGSIGFVGSCRSALVAAVDPQQPERRVLAPVKQNLAALQPSLAYTVEVQNSETPAITWLGPTELTADELLAVPTKEILPLLHRETARDLFEDFMRDGPRTVEEVKAFVEQQALPESTLYRVKRELKIETRRFLLQGKRRSYWLLPHQQLPHDLQLEAVQEESKDMLARLLKFGQRRAD